MADDARFPHVRIPKFILDRQRYPGMTPSCLATYVAARSFAYFGSKANERFAKAFPSLRSIARRSGQGTRTVCRNLASLESMGLISTRARFNDTDVIYFVDFPERFKTVLEARGKEAAQDDEDARLGEIRDAARVEAARASRPTSRRSRTFQCEHGNPGGQPFSQPIGVVRMSNACSQDDRGCSQDGDLITRSEEREEKNTPPDGGDSPSVTSPLPKDNHNGNISPKETAINSRGEPFRLREF